MRTIKAIVVEDEKEGMQNILIKIGKIFPKIEVIDKCYSGASAIDSIEKNNPDLVFLDVHLGNMTGFDVLNKLPHVPFEVIFTTASDKYAIEAIKVNATDYLLKPIKVKELEMAVEKAKIRFSERSSVKRISVPIKSGFQFIPIDQIVYCLADDSYTNIFRTGEQKKILVTKTLKHIAVKLPVDNFIKISRSAVINLDFVENFRRSNGGLVTMTNGDELSVSKERRNELLRRVVR